MATLLRVSNDDRLYILSGHPPLPSGLVDEELESFLSVSTDDYAALLKRLRDSESRAQAAEARLAAAAEDLAKMKIFAEEFVMSQAAGDETKVRGRRSVE